MVLSTCSWRPYTQASVLGYAQNKCTYMEASSAKLAITARKPIQAIRKERVYEPRWTSIGKRDDEEADPQKISHQIKPPAKHR